MKIYSGIGSRKAPDKVGKEQTELASILETWGYWLRSGNAIRSDQNFARGVEKNAQIWLPSPDFEKEFQLLKPDHTYLLLEEDHPQYKDAEKSVDEYHPAPHKLRENGWKCMARNYMQVLGDYIPSEFVLCWTPGGEVCGGTAQAIRIATKNNIPVFNMGSPDWNKEAFLRKVQIMNILR